MSIPTDLKKIEEKRMDKPLTNTKGRNQPRNGTSWMYQPNQNNRQQNAHQQDFMKDVQPQGWYYGNNQIQPRRPFYNHGKPKQFGKAQMEKKSYILPQVKEAPIDMKTLNLTISPDNLYCFRGKFNPLSNMFQAPIIIDTNSYSSLEHYYQSVKVFMLAGTEKAGHMIKAVDASHAKSLSHRLLKEIPKKKVADWKLKEAPKILKHAIYEKFSNNSELKKKLLETGTAILAQCFENDNLYATATNEVELKKWATENNGQLYKIPTECTNWENIDYIPLCGKGRNLLGAILMMVRNELEEPPVPPKSEPNKSYTSYDEYLGESTGRLDALKLLKDEV